MRPKARRDVADARSQVLGRGVWEEGVGVCDKDAHLCATKMRISALMCYYTQGCA